MPLYRSPAKINPLLRVLGRRSDGFHELWLLFQTIDLHDEIEVDLAEEGIDLRVRGLGLEANPENLAYRAAEKFLAAWGGGAGVRLRLEKRIPLGGGLGGGSSNAATVLLALRELTGRPASIEELQPVARSLGADVPYFLFGGLALGRGRGDELTLLDEGDEEDLLLAIPGLSVSTGEVFAAWAAAAASRAPEPLDPQRDWMLWPRRPQGKGVSLRQIDGKNDLEAVVFGRYPEVARVYTALHQQGVENVRMTGSGACCFGFWPRDRPVPQALSAICRVEVVRTLSRRSLESYRRVS